MKTFMLRALWMVGLVLALACGSSNGGDDPTTDTAQPPGDSTTPPEDMTIPPVECDPVCAEGEVCNNGTCEAAPPTVCVPECDDSQVCNDGACEPASPSTCDPACEVGEECVDDTCMTIPPLECDPPCEDNGSCIEGVCVPNPPALCDPPCGEGETCENGTCVLDPTLVGAVPTSCGSPDQGLEPVDCTKNGDTNAQCVFSNHCSCSKADGFVCDNNGADDSPDCAPGISCVLDLSKVGMVPTSCGSPDQGLGPVDCTKYGDKNAQCIWGSFCICSVVDGFECEEVLAGSESQCVVGSSCVAATPSDSKTLTEIFEPIFQNQGCTAGYCHGGSVDELLLADVDSTYANLVNQAASIPACDLTHRVVPGNPEESILWHRVKPMADGEDPCVSKMPKGSNGLSEEDAQLVYDWIKGGALQ